MPYYNIFSEGEECKNYPDFKYCTTWMENAVSRDIFNSELEKYIAAGKTVVEPVNKEEKNNYVLIIVVIGLIILLGVIANIILVVKKRRRNSL